MLELLRQSLLVRRKRRNSERDRWRGGTDEDPILGWFCFWHHKKNKSVKGLDLWLLCWMYFLSFLHTICQNSVTKSPNGPQKMQIWKHKKPIQIELMVAVSLLKMLDGVLTCVSCKYQLCFRYFSYNGWHVYYII